MVLELVEVEELAPVFAAEEVRLEMSSRFKVEGNEKFIAGDYPRLVSVRGGNSNSRGEMAFHCAA